MTEPKKPTLRQLCYELGLAPRNDLKIFQRNHDELLDLLASRLKDIRTWSEERCLQYVEGLKQKTTQVVRVEEEDTRAGEMAARIVAVEQRLVPRVDFTHFTQGLPSNTLVVEVPAGQIGAIHELEPGFLKGCMYILGRLFHAQFIRVKYRGTSTALGDLQEPWNVEELAGIASKRAQDLLAAEASKYNEDGDGEQVPWNEDPESLCYQWWHQSMVHVDECVFATVEVPGFAGHYVLLIHPGER